MSIGRFAVLPLALSGCLAKTAFDVATAPVRVASKAVEDAYGALKGLLLASLLFLLAALVVDTTRGGPLNRPDWMVRSRTYPLLNATSASIADFVDRRRRGEPVFGSRAAINEADAAEEGR